MVTKEELALLKKEWEEKQDKIIAWCIDTCDTDLIENDPILKEKINKKLKSISWEFSSKGKYIGANINEKERLLLTIHCEKKVLSILFTRLPRWYLWKQTNEDESIVGYKSIEYGKEKETEEWYKSKRWFNQTDEDWHKAQKEIWTAVPEKEE